MVYVFCFFIALLLLLYITIYGKVLDYNIVLLMVTVAVSNGGYYALAVSHNLREAILATKVSYVLGIFSPTIIFFIICNICKVEIPRVLITIMYAVQLFIFMTVCTIGESEIYYKTAQYHISKAGAYLTKTYGPMHTVYVVTLVFYTAAGIIAGMYSLQRKTVVSRINVDTLIFVDLFMVGVYLIEHLVHIDFELIPVASTAACGVILIPLIKTSVYSAYSNPEIFDSEFNKNGYIIFNKNLKYMGCGDRAKSIFPELTEWEMEKNIPGNGGRFNTFLRPALMEFVKADSSVKNVVRTFEYKGKLYSYEIGRLLRSKKYLRGYYIMIIDVTEVIREAKGPA